MDNKKVIAGLTAGAIVGYAGGNLASSSIHKALIKKIEKLDEDFENSLSKFQLINKNNLERLVFDLDIVPAGSKEHKLLSIKATKQKEQLLDTLRPNQSELYKNLESAMELYKTKTRTTSILVSLLGGLAGGILVAKLSK